MSKKPLILIVLLMILCIAIAFRFAAAPSAGDETGTLTGESVPSGTADSPLSEEDRPAQPGEGPAGLPTPTV